MQTIIISPKNAITKGIQVSAFINPNSTHTTLMLNGLTISDLVKLQDYQLCDFISGNMCAIDLTKYDFSII